MDKKNKKSNFLRNLLATASITSVIIGMGNMAFADSTDVQNRAILNASTAPNAVDAVAQLNSNPNTNVVNRGYLQLTNNHDQSITAVLAGVVDDATNSLIRRLSQGELNELRQPAAVPGGSDSNVLVGAWAIPYYSQGIQKAKSGVAGYKVKSGGGIFGADTIANDNLVIGASLSVIKSDIKFRDYQSGDKTKANTLIFSVFASQQLVRDCFVQGVASFGSSNIKNNFLRLNTYNGKNTTYNKAKSSYNIMSFSSEVLFGYNAKLAEKVLLTPMFGVSYARFNNGGYMENGAGPQNNIVSKAASNNTEAILGARLATSVDGNGILMIPEVHAFISQSLGNGSGKVNARINGMNESFIGRSDKTAKTFYNLGLGVTAKSNNDVMEYGVIYDAYLASKYVGNQGTLTVRVNF